MAIDRNQHPLKLGQLVTIENRVYRVSRANPNTICGGCAFIYTVFISCIRYVPHKIHSRLPVGYVFKRVRV